MQTQQRLARAPFAPPRADLNQGLPVAAADGASVTVYILDYIGPFGFSAADFLPVLGSFGKISDITVKINSPGGSAFDGVAIYNALAAHEAPVRVEILGIAASAASLIALAGDEIYIGKVAEMMIHMPLAIAFGHADDFEKMAADLRLMEEDFIDVYTDASNLKRREMEALLRDETFLTAKRCVEIGLCDGLISFDEKKEKAAQARFGRDAVASMANVATGRLSRLLKPSASGDTALEMRRRREAELVAERNSYR